MPHGVTSTNYKDGDQMKEAIIGIVGFFGLIIGLIWLRDISERYIYNFESECINGRAFLINGQFSQCVKVKAEVIK